MPGQSQHVKEFGGLLLHIRENDLRSRSPGRIDNAEQDRNADTVDELGVRKVDDQFGAAFVETAATLAFYLLTGQFVQIVAGEHNGTFIIRIHGFWF